MSIDVVQSTPHLDGSRIEVRYRLFRVTPPDNVGPWLGCGALARERTELSKRREAATQ